MYKKISELGRSMVEMLGTLAIIGVLSIGGIMGYNYGINKYRANETIRDVTLYAMTASQQLLVGQTDFNFGELGNGVSTLGYAIDGEHGIIDADTGKISEGSEDYFYIYVDGVPPRVCERILDSDWSAPLVMEVNGKAYTNSVNICYEDEADTVDMAFQFVADLNGDTLPYGTCETDTDCIGNCATCSDGLCVSACTDGQICLRDIRGGNMMCCPRENRAGPYCCPSTKNGMCCNESGQCCPWNMPLADKDGNCYACDTTTAKIDITGVESNNDVCPNRETFGRRVRGGDTDKPIYSVPKCSSDQWLDFEGNCRNCNTTSSYYFSVNGGHPDEQSQCVDICDGKREIVAKKYCNLACGDDQVQTMEGCKSCETSSIINLHGVSDPEAECQKCGDKGYAHTYYDDNQCVVGCPTGQFRGKDGNCYSCDTPDPVNAVGTAISEGRKYCETACPGVRVSAAQHGSDSSYNFLCAKKCSDNQYMAWDGSCNDCIGGPNKTATKEECNKCPNRTYDDSNVWAKYCNASCDDDQFMGADGGCYDCTEESSIEIGTNKNVCSGSCSNRVLNGSNANNIGNLYCSLPCSDGTFADNDGECVPCDDEESVYLYGQSYARAECGKCGNSRNLYYLNTNSNYFMCAPKCPSDKPLIDRDGNCYPCDYEDDISMKFGDGGLYASVCETVCSGEREMDGDYCVLKED